MDQNQQQNKSQQEKTPGNPGDTTQNAAEAAHQLPLVYTSDFKLAESIIKAACDKAELQGYQKGYVRGHEEGRESRCEVLAWEQGYKCAKAERPNPAAADATILEQVDFAVRSFATAIEHGDETHRQWLRDAATSFVENGTIPPKPCPCLKAAAATVREWTADSVYELYCNNGLDPWQRMADAINAAIAAERKENLFTLWRENDELKQQLAAMRQDNIKTDIPHGKK